MAILEGVIPAGTGEGFKALFSSAATYLMLACGVAVLCTIIFVFVFTRRFGYFCNIYSQRGSGKVLEQLKARKIGKPGEVEKLYIMRTKETIPMPDGNFVYPYGNKYVINFYRDSSRQLHPAQLSQDDHGNIFLKTNEQDVKFWFINQCKEVKNWDNVITGLAKIAPILGIIFLSLCFIMFLFYMNKTHAEDTNAEYAYRSQVLAANERLVDRLDMIAQAKGLPSSDSLSSRTIPNG